MTVSETVKQGHKMRAVIEPGAVKQGHEMRAVIELFAVKRWS